MRVALLSNTSWYLWNFRQNLIAGVLHAGHDVVCVAPPDEYSARLRDLGAVFVPAAMAQGGANPCAESLSLLSLFSCLSRAKPNVLLTFTPKGNIYGGIVGRILGVGRIANVSGLGQAFDGSGMLRQLVGHLYRCSMTGAHRVFFQNTQDMMLFVERTRLVSKNSARLLPGSGVDLKRFRPVEAPNPNLRRVMLMYGRLVPSKGFDHYLSAAEELADEAEFRVMGIRDPSRRESEALHRRLSDAHGRGTVAMRPATDDVRGEVASADVVVLPSVYNEGVPRTLLEGMACGKPVITTDWKGCRDTVDDGVNGFLVKPNDADDLTRKIKKMIDMSAEQLAAMGRASREKAEREFDEQIVLDAYLEEIEKCLESRGARQ